VRLLPSNPSVRVGLVSFLRAAGRDREARSAQAEAERLFPADAGVRQMRQQLGGGRPTLDPPASRRRGPTHGAEEARPRAAVPRRGSLAPEDAAGPSGPGAARPRAP